MPLTQDRAEPLECSRQASFLEIFAETLIEHALSDAGEIEELEGLAEADQLVQRLRNRREIYRRPLHRRVGERVLLGENRLAAAWRSRDQVDRVSGQPAAKDRVKPAASA